MYDAFEIGKQTKKNGKEYTCNAAVWTTPLFQPHIKLTQKKEKKTDKPNFIK